MLPISRRETLKIAAGGAAGWFTSVAQLLAADKQPTSKREPARSVILLWLAGGPSQLETFDPHPGKRIAAGTRAIETAAKGIQLAEGLPHLAEQMDSVSLVRSLVSKEGDHERGTYLVKTGYRPNPTAVHASIGAVICHQHDKLDLDSNRIPKNGIPRHISILPGSWPARGGMLGDEYDAFKTGDPREPVPDMRSNVSDDRTENRLRDLDALEQIFARGRRRQVKRTLHRETMAAARKMMSSEQLKAFDVSEEPKERLEAYGDTPFGRGCLAARRLVEAGVRCVEVTLGGWDTHANNHSGHKQNLQILDPAFAALIQDLRQRDLLNSTVVICGGEFGRTPNVNLAQGRDHWPHGFSMALAGGGIAGGRAIGATDPEGGKKVEKPHRVAGVHATVLHALGIDHSRQITSNVGRPIKLSEGEIIRPLLH